MFRFHSRCFVVSLGRLPVVLWLHSLEHLQPSLDTDSAIIHPAKPSVDMDPLAYRSPGLGALEAWTGVGSGIKKS